VTVNFAWLDFGLALGLAFVAGAFLWRVSRPSDDEDEEPVAADDWGPSPPKAEKKPENKRGQ